MNYVQLNKQSYYLHFVWIDDTPSHCTTETCGPHIPTDIIYNMAHTLEQNHSTIRSNFTFSSLIHVSVCAIEHDPLISFSRNAIPLLTANNYYYKLVGSIPQCSGDDFVLLPLPECVCAFKDSLCAAHYNVNH